MKRILTTLVLVSLIACFGIQTLGQEMAEGIAFEAEGTLFAQVVQKAKSSGKLIFVDCYTSWCGPCKMMAKLVFPQKAVGDFMNPKFVSLKMNMETGEGPEWAEKWQISAYPTFIVFTATGQEIGRFLGGCSAEEFIEKITKASDDKTSAEMDKRFADGERDEAFLYSYLKTLGSAYKHDQCNAVAEILLQGKEETFAGDSLLSSVFMRYLRNPFAPAFVYTAKHPQKLIAALGETPVKMKLQNVWSNYARGLITQENGTVTLDRERMNQWLALMKECGVEKPTREDLRLTTLMNYSEKKEDWQAYVGYIQEYGKQLDIPDLTLCKWCSSVVENCREEAPRKEVLTLLQQRVADLESGRRTSQTQMGNMKLSGNMKKAMEMLIDVLNGKEIQK